MGQKLFGKDPIVAVIMQKRKQTIILAIQMIVFAMGRVFDDLTWHDIGVEGEVNLFESLSIGCMLVCLVMQLFRKRHIDGIWWILFLRSQLSFFIVWALQITTVILYFASFSCQDELPESELSYFYILYPGCCLTATQIMLTTLNYSLVCNTKTEWGQFLAIEFILFGEIIYAGHLMLYSINHLEGKPKDYTIFLLTIIIANQMLMMDLIFRAAFEDREREEANERKLIHFYRKTFVQSYRQSLGSRHLSTPHSHSSRSTRIAPLELQPRQELTISLRG